jgi:predicted acetyltransferase
MSRAPASSGVRPLVSTPASEVDVRAASGADLALLRNLYPLYLHDLTAFTDLYDVDDRGVFYPDYLSDWLDSRSPWMHPFIVREGGRPAGFALVAQAPYPHMGRTRSFRMCEFFVLNRARRRGVGRRTAHTLFAMFPGVWEVSQLPPNQRAVLFWRRVIGEYAGAFTETMEHGDVVQVFDTRRG